MNYLGLQTPLAKAKNLGAAGAGTHHWWHQRLTSVIMIILLPWVMCIISHLSRLELSGVIEAMRSPSRIVPMMLFIIISFYHAALGMRVVIEGYVPNLLWRYMLILIVQIFSVITVMSAIIALISLMIL